MTLTMGNVVRNYKSQCTLKPVLVLLKILVSSEVDQARNLQPDLRAKDSMYHSYYLFEKENDKNVV